MTSAIALTGSCLCGAVTYEVRGPFNMMVHCHCSMCRKHHGAAFATFVGAPLTHFPLKQEVQLIASLSSSHPSDAQGRLTSGQS